MVWEDNPEEIAEHHETHLQEYIATQNLSVEITGFEALTELYAVAFMVIDEQDMKPIRDALKPHRGLVYES